MTELDTLIAVVGTLGGTLAGLLLGYILDERRETARLRRETALRPLEEKQSAMRDAYNKLIDLIFAIKKEPNGEVGLRNTKEASERFTTAVGRILIWMPGSQDALSAILGAEITMREFSTKIVRGEKLTEKEVAELATLASKVISILGNQLGVDILDAQLQAFAKSAVQ